MTREEFMDIVYSELHSDGDNYRANRIIDAADEYAEEQTRWIPVSERLPKGSDIVLLSLPPHIDPDGEECSASVICGHYIGGRNAEWGLSDGDTFGYGLVSVRKGTNPVAWMPLPEPYKASPTGAESEVEDADSN